MAGRAAREPAPSADSFEYRGDWMSRHYGGDDVHMRRRVLAGVALVIRIVLIFVLVGGC